MSLPPPREGSRDTREGLIISKFPDVCRSPQCPVPYTVVAYQSDDANTAASVRMTGQRAHKQNSVVTRCTGDEPGTGLGVKSNTVSSVCHRKEHSSTVRIEGQWATRHGDAWYMNNRNTVGKLNWYTGNKSFDPTPPIRYASMDGPVANDAPSVATDTPFPVEQRVPPGIGVSDLAPGTPPPSEQASSPNLRLGQQSQPLQQHSRPTPATSSHSPTKPSDQWWSRSRLPPLPRGGIAGPGAMEGMAWVEHMLEQNVNQPQDWLRRGFWKKERTPVAIDPNAPQAPLGDLGSSGAESKSPMQLRRDVPAASGRSENGVSVKGRDDSENKCDCIVGAYKEIQSRCGAECGSTYQAHHIVPDYTLRYGSRKEAEANQKRIPGLPSFYDGPAICLEGQKATAGSEHSIAHEADYQIQMKGTGGTSPQGTLDVHSIMEISRAAANRASKWKCVDAIAREIEKQPSLASDILGRATIQPPKEGDDAYKVLSVGGRAIHH